MLRQILNFSLLHFLDEMDVRSWHLCTLETEFNQKRKNRHLCHHMNTVDVVFATKMILSISVISNLKKNFGHSIMDKNDFGADLSQMIQVLPLLTCLKDAK